MSIRTLRSALVALALLLVAAVPARAQRNSDGSLYSHFGIGALQTFGSSQIEAMGGAATGLRSFTSTNFENPAAWSDQVLTRAMVGVSYQNIIITDAQENRSRLSAGALNAIQFSFPIVPRRFGAAIGFQPFSRSSFRVEEEGHLTPDPTVADSVLFLVDHEGRGGLQQVVGGVGYRPWQDLSVGAHVGFLFGILEDARRTSFPDDVLLYAPTELVTATRMSGVTGRVGVLYSPTGILSDRDQISIGATFTLPASLRGSRVRTLGESLDVDTLGTRARGSVKLPLSAGLGVSYRPDDRWIFTADGLYQPWTAFTSDFAFAGYTSDADNNFTDRIRAGAGFEFLPAGSDLLTPYFARVAYRLGFYYDRLYVSPVQGVELRTIAVTGGLSLPTLVAGTYVDLNLSVGTQGTTDQGLVRDVFYRFSATMNIGERWFQRQRLR